MAPLLTILKGMSSLLASLNLILTDIGYLPSVPVALAVGGSVAVLAGAIWYNNRTKNSAILSSQQELRQETNRGHALVAKNQTLEAEVARQIKRIDKYETTLSVAFLMIQRSAKLEDTLVVVQKELHSSQVTVRSLQTRNGTLVEEVASLNEAKTKDAELISQLKKRAGELELADSSVSAENNRLKDLVARSQERITDLEATNKSLASDNETLQRDLARAALNSDEATTEEPAKPSNTPETDGDKRPADVPSPTNEPKGTSEEPAEPSNLPATDGDKRPADAPSPTHEPAEQRGRTEEPAKPSGTPETNGDKRPADVPSPTGEPAVQHGEATPSKAEDSQSVRKQAASKYTESRRITELQLRFIDKANEYTGLINIGPLDYTELGGLCKGFRADQLDLIVAKS